MANDQELKKSNELNNSNILDISSQVANAAPTAADDEITGNKAGNIYISPETLLANDSDIDGDAIRGVSLHNAVNGTVHWDGVQVIFIPADGYSGPASFDYTITDDKGGYDTATVNLNIVANSAPVAVDDSVEGYANTDIVISATELLANDTDANGDALIGVSLQDAVNGTVSWDGENVTFTPDEGYEGPASFSYTVKDVHGETSTATVNLTVKPNERPVANDDQLSYDGLYNQPTVIFASTFGEIFNNDADAETQAFQLRVNAVDNAVNGNVELQGHRIVFTPETDYVGAASFRYTLIDEHGSTDTATVRFNISANRAPVANDDQLEGSAFNPLIIAPETLLANDTDIDGDALKGIRVYGAENGKVEWDGNNVIFTPNDGYEGPASFWYDITDGNDGYDKAKVNLTIKPYVGAVDDHVIATHHDTVEILAIDLLRNDIGDGTRKLVSVQGAEHGSVVLKGGVISFTPDPDYSGTAKFTYTLQDNNGVNDTATVNIEVKDEYVRTVTTQSAYSLEGGYNIELYVPEHSSSRQAHFYSEQNGSVETYAYSGFGTIIGADWITDDGFIGQASYDYSQYIPDWYASYDYDVDHAFILAGRVKINVEENFAPTANHDAQSGVVDQAIITSVGRLLANDIDREEQEVKILSVQDAINGTVELKDNNVIFTPTAGYIGDASYTYTMIDRQNYQSTATVKLSIKAAADGVLADEGETLSILERKGVTVSADDPDSLLSNADGLNPYITSYTVEGSDRAYSVGVNQRIFDNKINLIVNSDGSYELTNYAGNYFGELPAIHYTVRDDNGNETVSTLNINITNVNDAPSVTNSWFETEIRPDERHLITTTDALISKHATDVEGDELTITSVHSGHLGTVELVGNEIYFTPLAGEIGKASFQFTVSDGNGGESTGVYHLTISPTAKVEIVDDAFTTIVDGDIRLPLSVIKRNDSVNATEKETTVHDAVNGTVRLENNEVIFTPDVGYKGPASFRYTVVTDEPVKVETATVNLEIKELTEDTPLIANDDTFVFDQFQQTYTIKPDEIKANDTTRAGIDPKDLSLTMLDAQNADVIRYSGSVSPISWDYFVIKPENGYSGPVSFQYMVKDYLGNIDYATVNLNLPQQVRPEGVNDQLITFSDSRSIKVANELLLNNDTDPNNDALSLVSTQNAVNGEVNSTNNEVLFTIDLDSSNGSFQYSIHDGYQNYHFAQVDVTLQDGSNLQGTDSDDILLANSESNTINAGDGDDLIIGGTGNDQLSGGLGADTFVWNLDGVDISQLEVDTVKDFIEGEDKLDLKDFFSYSGFTDLEDYIVVDIINDNTELQVRTYANAPDPALLIVLEGTDLSNGGTLTNAQIMSELQSTHLIYD